MNAPNTARKLRKNPAKKPRKNPARKYVVGIKGFNSPDQYYVGFDDAESIPIFAPEIEKAKKYPDKIAAEIDIKALRTFWQAYMTIKNPPLFIALARAKNPARKARVKNPAPPQKRYLVSVHFKSGKVKYYQRAEVDGGIVCGFHVTENRAAATDYTEAGATDVAKLLTPYMPLFKIVKIAVIQK